MSDATFWCPRRNETACPSPGPDTWKGRPGIDLGIGPCCSYCGGLRPGEFLDRVRDGWIVSPTDRATKAYLDEPYSAEVLESIKTTSAIWKAVRLSKIDEGATDAEATAAANEYWELHEARFHKGRTVAKLYFAHLSPAQQDVFCDLYNSGAMRLAYPGRFYVRPFFARLVGAGVVRDG